MRTRAVVGAVLAASLVLVPAPMAGATHTGCEHHRGTGHAHQTVPHHHEHGGTHTAHGSIPYCPPQDAPRHQQR